MILVDSSVWVDYFRGTPTPQTNKLDLLLGSEPLVVGDLILVEVLQGFGNDKDFNRARRLLSQFDQVELCGCNLAIQAARNHQRLRSIGITVRKTIDTIIATHCIESNLQLLHDDRDFEPFVTHLGLISVFQPG